MVARSKAYVCGPLLAGIAGSNTYGGHGWLSLVSVVCCQVEFSASRRSLVKRTLAECLYVVECDPGQK